MYRMEITSRMAPRAIFKAFRPIYNEDIYSYDMQNIAVDLEDKTLVSTESYDRLHNFSWLFVMYGPVHRGHINHVHVSSCDDICGIL